jgi:hypothetical protein
MPLHSIQTLIFSLEYAIFSSLYVTILLLYIHQASVVCVDTLQNSDPKIVLDLMCHNAVENEYGC